MRDVLLFFVSLFSIVNPFSAIPAFVGLTADLPRTDGLWGHVGVLSATLVVSLLAWVILLAAGPIAKGLGRTGLNIATRFMGLILAAIAVEFITSGLGEIFPGWKA